MTAGAQDNLLQYGAIGALLLLALWAVVKLFQRQVNSHDQALERADRALEQALAQGDRALTQVQARADRAEAQLESLNALIIDKLVIQLTRTADVTARVAEQMADQRREGAR